jgi:predicted deacylase
MNSAHVRVSFRVLGSAVLAASIFCITGAPQAMAQQGASAVTAPAKSAPAKRQPVYIDPAHFDPVQLVAPPPADGTPRAKAIAGTDGLLFTTVLHPLARPGLKIAKIVGTEILAHRTGYLLED